MTDVARTMSTGELRAMSFDPWRLATRFVLGLVFIIFILGEIYPIFWLLVSSLKAPDEFTLYPIYSLPRGFYWQNYVDAYEAGMARYFRNSVVATVPAVAITVLFSAAAAFAIEIMRWRYSHVTLIVFLTGIMIPIQMVLLPIFAVFLQLRLLNTLYGLILLYSALGIPVSIFLISGYIKSLPKEVIEAAVVDGASIYRVFFRIVLPMTSNSLMTVALVQFFFFWNELLLSLTFVSNPKLKSVQTGLLAFVGEYGEVSWGPTFAGIAFAVIPTLALYLLMNKYIIKGLTSGAVKG